MLDLRVQGHSDAGRCQGHRPAGQPGRQCIAGAQEADTDTPTLGSHSLINGLAVLAHAHPQALRVAEDVAKYHFGGFRYLCLRCGSLFDEPGTEEASEPAKQPR